MINTRTIPLFFACLTDGAGAIGSGAVLKSVAPAPPHMVAIRYLKTVSTKQKQQELRQIISTETNAQ